MGIAAISTGRKAYRIDIDYIEFQPNFNRRSTRAKREILKAQILQAGEVRTAITGYFDPVSGKFLVNHGHGRVELTKELLNEGKDVKRTIPAEVVSAPKNDEELAELIAQQVVDNDSEEFTPLDRAKISKELKDNFGWTNVRLANKWGVSESNIGQLLKIIEQPETVQTAVENGSISATLATEIIQEHKENAPVIIEAAIADATAKGKKRATAKNVEATQQNVVKKSTPAPVEAAPVIEPIAPIETGYYNAQLTDRQVKALRNEAPAPAAKPAVKPVQAMNGRTLKQMVRELLEGATIETDESENIADIIGTKLDLLEEIRAVIK